MAYNESRNDAAAKEKAIDDWLPITSSRKAKWWCSTFHNVTAMVGAGVLSLPYAMAQLGWYICFIFYHDRTIFKDDIELIWLLINRYIYVDQYVCVCVGAYLILPCSALMKLQGTRNRHTCFVMGDHVVHSVANGRNA